VVAEDRLVKQDRELPGVLLQVRSKCTVVRKREEVSVHGCFLCQTLSIGPAQRF
jgi:hypothetical protein